MVGAEFADFCPLLVVSGRQPCSETPKPTPNWYLFMGRSCLSLVVVSLEPSSQDKASAGSISPASKRSPTRDLLCNRFYCLSFGKQAICTSRCSIYAGEGRFKGVFPGWVLGTKCCKLVALIAFSHFCLRFGFLTRPSRNLLHIEGHKVSQSSRKVCRRVCRNTCASLCLCHFVAKTP